MYFSKLVIEGGEVMDQMKIAKFIAEQRKKQNLTQSQLAEQLYVTDRAVSKWECGKSLPDSSIMLQLCGILKITVNELLTGEKIDMEKYNEQAELNLIEITKQKEESDRRLLRTEIVIGVTGTVSLISLMFISIFGYKYGNLPLWAMITLISIGAVAFFASCFVALRIEQKAGYYECAKCHHRYVPTYKQVNMAPHMGRSRYMKCPCCGEKSWSKKVISK